MANNRMVLVCKQCNVGRPIAKFYPQGGFIAGTESGWGQFTTKATGMDEFFVRHSHVFDKSSFGGQQYFLGYEQDGLNWEYERLSERSE